MEDKDNYLKKEHLTVGRYLFSLYSGWSKITEVTKEYVTIGGINQYTLDGRFNIEDTFSSLFPTVPKGFKDPNKFIDKIKNLNEGDMVWTISDGWVVVECIGDGYITTQEDDYHLNGKWEINDLFPSLYIDKPECFN